MRTVHHDSENAAGVFARGLGGSRRTAALRRGRRRLRPFAEGLEGRTLLSVGLDQNFGFGGVAQVNAPPNTTNASYSQVLYSIALENGQVVTAGILRSNIVTPASTSIAVIVARLTTGGTFDNSFGSSGVATVPTTLGGTTYNADANFHPDIAVQSGGSIDVAAVVASTAAGSSDEIMVAQFTPGGSLDASFGTSGVALIPVATGYSLSVADRPSLAMALGPDGKIVVAASLYATAAAADVFGVYRLNTNGTPDTTFNTSGFATAAFPNGTATATDDDPYGVVVQPDNRVVVAGTAMLPAGATPLTGTPSDFAVARFNDNGTLDTTFNTTGLFTLNFGLGGSTSADLGRAVTLEGSQIVIAGYSIELFPAPTGGAISPVIQESALARLNPNGTLDTSFNGSGKFTLAFSQAGITFNSNAFGVTTLADGSLLFGGRAFEQNSGLNSNAMLAHLTSAGTLDTTYGTGGVALLPGTVNSHLLVQTDGKVVYLNPSNIYRTTAPVPAVQSAAIVTTGTGSKAKAAGVTITFNTPVNPTLARNVKIYMLRGGKPKKTLKLKGPVLDATGRMLTFNFAKRSIGKGFLLVITPGAIVGADGEVANGGAPITITIPPTVTAAAARKR